MHALNSSNVIHNSAAAPLADRIRPRKLKDFVGQRHLVGPRKPIRLAIKTRAIHSMIFWGPPGCGKTTLARIIANEIKAEFHNLSAVSAGKADIKKIIHHLRSDTLLDSSDGVTPLKLINKGNSSEVDGEHKAILFLDEIHRFNKAQQDFLLPYVEDGTLILIGATTENPSFEVISALLSRTQVYVLEPLSKTELKKIIKRALSFWSEMAPRMVTRKGSSEVTDKNKVTLSKESIDFLIEFSNGDARQALNLLETTVSLYARKRPGLRTKGTDKALRQSRDRKKDPGISTIAVEDLKSALQSKFLQYDKKGDEHYNTISAFIKSMRASDANAALYYLARMVNAGEDPLFIARRMVIFASEDIGMVQPTALVVANEVFRACETIGYPEAQINLAHGVVYLASAKKDRAAYEAYFQALADVKKHGNLPIPMNIRNAPTKLMENLGYGKGYNLPAKAGAQRLRAGKYTKESLLPDKLKNKKYYTRKN